MVAFSFLRHTHHYVSRVTSQKRAQRNSKHCYPRTRQTAAASGAIEAALALEAASSRRFPHSRMLNFV